MKCSTVLLILMLFVCPVAPAQQAGAPPALFMAGEDILAELERVAAASASAAGWSVTVAPGISIRRRSSAVANYAVMHPYSMEIYRILEGSGTLVTGGVLVLPLAESTDPNIIRSQNGIQGGLSREVRAGDVLVLQPGTPHWFSAVNGESITYMESRVRITTHPVQYQ